MRKVWRHSGIEGNVWVPHISNINKPNEKFREGLPLKSKTPQVPDLRDDVDWYWTPAVSLADNRRIKQADKSASYPDQRAVWVDCDDSYNRSLLEALKPTMMWETSAGHMQAIWLMREKMPLGEFHRDGFVGMLTQALGADKSGVDISQLLRVPGTNHHKGKEFHGKVLRDSGAVFGRAQLLQRVAKGLGFSPALASELAAVDPYGDRSKLLWKFARRAAELGLPQDLTFKLIKATKWNKWRDEPDRLKEDIARAYEQQPVTPETTANPIEDDEVTAETVTAWEMADVAEFGPVVRKPMKWVVPGIVPEAGCGLLVAAPKVGKTRIAIELALGVATGRTPLGLSVRRPQPVGFFSLEDGEYLFADRLGGSLNRDRGRYQYHWDGHIKREGGKLVWHEPETMPLLTRFDPVDLSDDLDKQRLAETIERYSLKLVVLDTLSMSIGKAEVSSSTDMYSILKDLKIIAKATGCAIMFIHHTRKRVFEKGESIQEMVLGSTALHAWSDFIMNLASPEEDSDFLRLGVQTKMGNALHLINPSLKIVKRPPVEEVLA